MQQKIKEIVSYINNPDQGWYSLKPEFERILGEKPIDVLIDELEDAFDIFHQNKLPQYCLIYYLALLIIIEEKNMMEIVEIVKKKKSYYLMKNGLRIFLSAKSSNLKYEGQLLDSRYKNKYHFIDFFSGFVPDYEIELRGYLNILELIYSEDKHSFWELLSFDKQNVIALCFLVNGRLTFDYEELIPFLTSEDKLRANGAFFYLMDHFSFLFMKYQSKKTEKSEKALQQEIKKINIVFQRLPFNRRVHLIINYLFEEAVYPSFFGEELQQSNIQVVLNELMEQDMESLYKLVQIHKVMGILRNMEIEQLFAEHFLYWVKNESNINIWESAKDIVKEIVGLISSETKRKLLKELANYKETLFISSFDRQVRFSMYLKEKDKVQVIEDTLNW